MTREEALKLVKRIKGAMVYTEEEKEALETLIPELKESEDERIIKTLQEYVKNRNWPLNGPTQDEALAWLDKQKEKKPNISIDQLKSMMLQYLQEAANEKDDSDIEADTDKWARKILGYDFEQKPVERDEEDERVRKWLLEYFYLHRDDLRGASVTSMEILSFLDNHPGKGKACDVDEFSLTLRNCLSADSELTDEQADTFARAYGEDLYKVALGEMEHGIDRYDIEEYRNEVKFNPKPGEKFWVRCKTDKAENLWFDKGDERPAYAVTDANGFITYIVHIKKDGTGNCVSYQNKEKFLETFEIIENMDELGFNPKPGEIFWVRCKTDKSENMFFEKGAERPAYPQRYSSGVMYAVYVNIDGTGNCIFYPGMEELLKTFDILESKR